MRTKHLLYTMALAGIFAACTQDEFETVNGADALTGRKSIGQVTFTEAPSTRWAVESWDKIAPEADDAFSLMLVDNPRTGLDGMHLYPIDNYELIEKAQTNYIFKKGANGWSNEAELVEGNYLYVAPAQEGKLDRNTVEINLPTEQNLSLGADGKIDPLSAIKDFVAKGYPFYIGHRFLSEGGSVSLPNMQSIFAYPEITITQTDAYRDEVAVVKKVIIKQEAADDAFVINAPLHPKKAATLLTNEFFTKRGEDKQDKVVIGDWAGHANAYFGVDEEIPQNWGSNEKNNTKEIPEDTTFVAHNMNGQVLGTYLFNKGLYGTTSELLGDPQSKSQYIVINMPGDGVALKYGETIKFNAVIPAATYKLTEENEENVGLTIYAVLENNEAYKKVVTSTSPQKVIEMYPGKRYPNQDYTGLKLNSGAGKYFTIDLCEKEDGTNKYIRTTEAAIGGVKTINTTEDLIAAIQAHTSAEHLNLTIEGRNVKYNKAVNEAVTNNKSQQVTIQGHIGIQAEEGTTLNLYSRVLIEDATIEEGGKIVASENNLKKVVVAPGAELELTDAAGTNPQANITNAGTLTLNTTDFAHVENYGALKVKTDVTEKTANINVEYVDCMDGVEIISKPINLDPTVEVMAGGTYAISGRLNYPITVDAKDGNTPAGVLKLNDATYIVKDVEKKNNGDEIVKVGNIINNGNVTGEYDLAVETGRTMTVGQEATVQGKVIIKEASHKLSEITSGVADYEPAAVVYNAGTLNDVEVNGLLVMGNANARVDGEVSYTADDADEGEIDNTTKGVIAKPISGDKVVVFATINEINLDDHANTVKALKDYTTSTRQVTVFRLIGELKRVQSMENGEAVKLTNYHVGEAVTAIEFMAGSSITLGEVTVESEIDFVARAKEVLVNGRTDKTSILKATKKQGYRYLGKIEGKYKSELGSFKENNSTIK